MVISQVRWAYEIMAVNDRFYSICIFIAVDLPGCFKGCVHNLAASTGDFTATVRSDMTAGGDNCSRLVFVGSCMGTYTGLAG